METSDQVRCHSWASLIAAEKTSMFLPPPPPPPPCFPLCLACLAQSLPPVKDISCCPGSFLNLLTGQRKLFLTEIIFREVSEPWGCREEHCRARHSGVLEAELSHWLSCIKCLHLKDAMRYCRSGDLNGNAAERSSPVPFYTPAICCPCSLSSWIGVVSPAGSISRVSGCTCHFIPRYQLKFTGIWGL